MRKKRREVAFGMRPKFLKIKGLNSFFEEQVIDFSKLTERGFFGIFGPTGSGKSTILDAIIYALYGKVPRGAKEIMNTASEELSVSYEFEIENGNMRCLYRVERNIKRDKHGNYRPPYVRLLHLKNDDEILVLGDKIGTVENEIIRIIGLKADDFTRSVVLPQGKFNEFLKLDGRPKRDMLERIFGLEKYGDQLLRKINDRKKLKELDIKELLGELKSYEGASEEELCKLEESLKILVETEKQLTAELAKLELQYEKYRTVWELQLELKKYNLKKNELGEKKEEMNNMAESLAKGKAAAKVRPHIEALSNTRDKRDRSFIALKELTDRNKIAESDFIEAEKTYNAVRDEKEKELPLLIKKQGELVQAINLLEKLSKLEKERADLLLKHKALNSQISLVKAKREETANNRNNVEAELRKIEKRIEEITIQPFYREKLNRANMLVGETKRLDSESNLLGTKIHNMKTEVKGLYTQYEKTLAEVAENNSLQERLKDQIKKLELISPGDNNKLLNLQLEQQEIDKKLREALINDKAVKELKDKNDVLEADKKQLAEKLRNLENLQSNMHEELKQVLSDIKTIHSASMAAMIADALKEGGPCPVCGSSHHPCLAEKLDVSILDEKEKRREALENEIQVYAEEINEIRVKLATIINQIDSIGVELDKLCKELSDINIVELERKKTEADELRIILSRQIEEWTRNKQEAESLLMNSIKERADIEGRYSRLKTNIEKDNSLLMELEEKSKALQESLKTMELECVQIKDELKIEDILPSYNRMKLYDEEFSRVSIMHKKALQEFNILNADIEKDDSIIKSHELELATIVENGRSIKAIIEADREELSKLSEGKEPVQYKKETDSRIEEIVNKEKQWKSKLEDSKDISQRIKEELAGEEKNFETLDTIFREQQIALEQALKSNGFISIEEVEAFTIPSQHMQEIEDTLKKYDSECRIVDADILRVKNSLKEEYIDEVQWNSIKAARTEKSEEKERTTEQIFVNKKTVFDVKEKIKKAKMLEEKRKKMEHEYSVLEDLYKLFQGNRFVEYIATNQLKYIAKEASRRLKEITRGRYALELDSSGNFIMRDDFNGGVRRSTDTLSGGETFYTSLALALALSSQIQMKGRGAPLEFFFLDEGFGTLDSELLDTVMSSLEKLRSDKLCVGIISHVEELKNRVPVKLMVTSADAGLSGTRVNIEYS